MRLAHSVPWRLIVSAPILLGLAGGTVTAGADPASPPKCRKAEINPDPLGAPVEALPEEAKPRCKPEEARGQWSYGPACAPELGGS